MVKLWFEELDKNRNMDSIYHYNLIGATTWDDVVKRMEKIGCLIGHIKNMIVLNHIFLVFLANIIYVEFSSSF